MDSRLRGNDGAGVVVGVCDIGVEFNLPQPEYSTKNSAQKWTFYKKTSTKINERIKYPSQRPCRHQSDDHA